MPEVTLLDDFTKMRRNELFADVTFQVGLKTVKAHRCILAARCPVFKNMLTMNMREGIEKNIVIDDMHPETFEKLLDYLYTEKTPFIANADDAIELLVAANTFDLERLKKLCEKFLVSSI